MTYKLFAPPQVIMHFGFNGFSLTGGKAVLRRAEAEPKDDANDWFQLEIAVPKHAYVLDFVFSDGGQGQWDNNDRKDYAALLGELEKEEQDKAWESAIGEEMKAIAAAREAARILQEELDAKRRAESEVKRRAARAVRAKQLRHVIYTVPEEVTVRGSGSGARQRLPLSCAPAAPPGLPCPAWLPPLRSVLRSAARTCLLQPCCGWRRPWSLLACCSPCSPSACPLSAPKQAGSEIEVHYNPDNTNLRGNGDIFLTGGFNRWTHEAAFRCGRFSDCQLAPRPSPL